MAVPIERTFEFTFTTKGKKYVLKAPVQIPLSTSVVEFVGRLTKAHSLPCFVEESLTSQLQTFVDEEVTKFYDIKASEKLKQLQDGKLNVDKLAQTWSRAYIEEVLEYAKPEPVTNEAVFSEVYHNLIHSPALETLLNLEHTYAMAVGDIIRQRDDDLAHLEHRQREEMEEAVKLLGVTYTDDQINTLAQRHFDNTQLIESKWASELSNLQETQKREYRDWVMKVHEDTQATEGTTPAYVQRVRALSNTMSHDADDDVSQPPPRREESFTVHLGAQLKTMHNIRLVSADILDLCRHKSNRVGGVIVPQPQRLQTAMSLYSNSLCGMVLLVDNRLNSYTGIKRDFSRVCEQSTDFHFPPLEQQLEQLECAVQEGNHARAALLHHPPPPPDTATQPDRLSLHSAGSTGSADKDDRSLKLQAGDFYITRHSNLSEVHIVFHLVTDETVTSSVSDISSRHPVILGYRNMIKACFRYDIHTITIPLLLVHEMSEEMTIPWCLKRAELVFKCVKGFMMELSTWSGQESRTIQFLVPKGISDDTFQSISTMLPSIFRMSNPVMARSS